MKKALIYILVVIIVGAVGYFVFFSGNGDDEIAMVTIYEVKKDSITQTVSATGKIKPEVEVSISPEVPGEIVELPIKEGQSVAKGDLLVRINPDLLEASLNRAQAGLANAQANYAQAQASLKEAEANFQRSKTLYGKGVISKSDFDTATANYERAKGAERSAYFSVNSSRASLSESSDNLSRTSIYAPMDGTISLLAVEQGERVVGTQQMAGTELLRVADLSQMEVEVDVNENDIVKLELEDKAIVEVDAYAKMKFRGIVTEIANTASGDPTANQVTNFTVKISILPESYQNLLAGKPKNFSPFKPGMTATVEIITERKSDVVVVPISSIVIKTAEDLNSKKDSIIQNVPERGEYVFIAQNGKASLVAVETGIQDDQNIEITSGLAQGAKVISGPYALVTKELKDEDPIRTKGKDEVSITNE